MKYFTKERYEEMQVAGFLVFHETEKDWEEDVAWYIAEGINFEERCKESLEYRRNDLLKYLPESFHPYILDSSLNSKFPSDELRRMAQQWRSEYDKKSRLLGEEYRHHYSLIKNALPENVVQLCEKSLHDAKVRSVETPSEDMFIMLLDCRGGYHYHTDIKLTFTGVQKLQLPEVSDYSHWLYDEIYTTKGGFELHVLLDNPLDDLIIEANNVYIEVLS